MILLMMNMNVIQDEIVYNWLDWKKLKNNNNFLNVVLMIVGEMFDSCDVILLCNKLICAWNVAVRLILMLWERRNLNLNFILSDHNM